MCKRNSTDLKEKEGGGGGGRGGGGGESMGCVRESSHRKIKQSWDV